MNIGIACGGTGGHIFPGLAVAAELKSRGHDITLWLSGRDTESAAPECGQYRRIVVKSFGFSGSAAKRAKAAFYAVKAFLECSKRMKQQSGAGTPHAMLAMGGYASVPPALAAKMRGAALVLHEANAVPGAAALFLERFADAVAVNFEAAAGAFKRRRAVATGMPLRRELTDAAAAEGPEKERWFGDCFSVLVMGGSLGAKALNATAARAICNLHTAGAPIAAIHLCGAHSEQEIQRIYEENNVPARVFAFLHDMASAYRQADFAISRAGASSCAELLLFGLPMLLVPYPFAARAHQEANARVLQAAGAAEVILEKDLTAETLAFVLKAKMEGKNRSPASRHPPPAGTTDAARMLAELVEQSAKTKHGLAAH